MPIDPFDELPGLLEQYMEEPGGDERWVTVQELRDRFCLTRYQCNTVSGFLRRLESGAFGQFPFIVASITKEEGENPPDPKKCRYLLKLRKQYLLQRKQMKPAESVHGTQ